VFRLNKMYKAEKKLLFVFLIFYVMVGVLAGFILYEFFPAHYFSWYPIIPFTFTVFGFFLFMSLIKYKRKTPARVTMLYMMMRGVKFLITAVMVLIYTLLADEFRVEFSIATICFYFFYLLIESLIFINFEKEQNSK